MALAYRATPVQQASGGAITKQTGTASGDLILLFLVDVNDVSATITVPGFTAGTSASSGDTVQVFWRVADGTETTWTPTTSGTAANIRSIIATISGGAAFAVNTALDPGSASTSIAAPGLTVAATGSWTLWMARAGNAGIVVPAGYTSRFNTGSYALADNQAVGTGATGTITGTCTSVIPQAALVCICPALSATAAQSVTATATAAGTRTRNAAAAQSVTATRSVTVGGSWGLQGAQALTATGLATGRNAGAVQAAQALTATGQATGNVTYPPPGWTAVGAENDGNLFGAATFPLTNAAAGDLVIASVIGLGNLSTWPVSLSSAGCSWETVATQWGVNNACTATMFFGTVLTPGADTATITWSAGAPANSCWSAQEFVSSQGNWSLVQIAMLDAATAQAAWPALTATGPNQLYYGFCYSLALGTPGATSGFVWASDFNCVAYNVAVSGTVTPVWGNAQQVFGIMVMLQDPGNSPTGIPAISRTGGPTYRRRYHRRQQVPPDALVPALPTFFAAAAQTVTATATATLTAARSAAAAQVITATGLAASPGTLLVSIAGAAGTDSYGNTFPSGIGLTGQATTTNMLTVANVAGQTLAGIDASGNVQGQTVSANTDVILAGTSLGTLLYAYAVPNPWVAMTLLNGTGAAVSPNAAPSYQLSADETKVNITGVITGVKANTTFATLPAGYYNTLAQTQFPVTITNWPSGQANLPYLQCDTSGNLQIANTPGSGFTATVILGGWIDLVIPNSSVATTTSTFYPAQSWSYWGDNSTRNHNGTMYQGKDPAYGDVQYAYMDFTAVGAAIPSGAVINWATLRLKCLGSYYSTGMDASLFAANAIGGYGHLNGSVCLDQWPIGEGQTLVHYLAPAVVPYLVPPGPWPYLVMATNPWNSGSSSYTGNFYGAGGSTAYMPRLQVNWTH